MKYLLSFFFLLTCFLQAQTDKPSSIFMNLSEIEQPPSFVGCEKEEFETCSFDKITSYFIEQVDLKIIYQLSPEERIINLKFIVDSFGKVRRTMAQAKNETLKNEANRILKLLPDFNPGIHQGTKVNVIIDLFIQLETPGPLKGNSKILDSPAILLKCKDNEDPMQCTSRWVQDFVNTNFDTSKVKRREGEFETAVHFVIDEQGKVTEVYAKGTDENLNKEAIRVIKKLPDFIPATLNKKNIPVLFSLPISGFVAFP